jgi:RNA polymerase sigma-70 factor (ECF subfamily)
VRRGRVADTTRRRLALEPLDLSDRDIAAIEDAAADADVIADLQRALPADQFRALDAHILDERDYADIATELECSQSVVRKRVSRALAQLRSTRREVR